METRKLTENGTFAGLILTDGQPAHGSSIEVLDPVETTVRLPRGWSLFQTGGRGEYQLLCRPTDADVLAELSSVMRQVQEIRSGLIPEDSSWGDLIEDFRSLSFQDSPDAWREWATTRMQDAERDVELAAQAIVEELGLESAQ